jgi:hypothetical protein
MVAERQSNDLFTAAGSAFGASGNRRCRDVGELAPDEQLKDNLISGTRRRTDDEHGDDN